MKYNKISCDKYNRANLTPAQQDFLIQIAYFSQYTQAEILQKCADVEFGRPTHFGIAPSVIAAHCIVKSNWGTHPVAREKYVSDDGVKWKHGNNLALIEIEPEVDRYYRDARILHEGREFKSFRNWGAFSLCFSDRITWTHAEQYDKVLQATTVKQQMEEMAALEPEPDLYFAACEFRVRTYGLLELDNG